jgi:hypothetical protein
MYWLKNFIEVWEHAQEVEDFIDQQIKERKENERTFNARD